MKRYYCKVRAIEQTGDCGMYTATLDLRNTPNGGYHDEAMTVIGENLTECVERVNLILNAFNIEIT